MTWREAAAVMVWIPAYIVGGWAAIGQLFFAAIVALTQWPRRSAAPSIWISASSRTRYLNEPLSGSCSMRSSLGRGRPVPLPMIIAPP